MPPVTPYTTDLGGREPLAAIADSLARLEHLTRGWTAAEFERPWAPGKWTVRQILVHLAQSEVAFGARARTALASPGFTTSDFDQDAWMAKEASLDGSVALGVVLALGRMNHALFATLSAGDRATPFSHPAYGQLTVDWLIHQLAGHQIHHLAQLERIAS